MRRRAGFTLVELLVVIMIILLISIATLPIVIPALYHRQVSEGARVLQAALVGARDAAVKANAPRGIRLIPDYQYNGIVHPGVLAASQIIPIEPGPDYSAGLVDLLTPSTDPSNAAGAFGPAYDPFDPRIGFQEVKFVSPGVPSEPTSWFWNLRQGDRIRFGDSGNYYTIAGPVRVGVYDKAVNRVLNPDRFINYGYPIDYSSLPINPHKEWVYVLNGRDDDGDGWVDEAFDGIDNDGDGITDPGFNGIDDDGDGVVDNWGELFIGYNANLAMSGEYEKESYIGPQFTAASFAAKPYTVLRRPVPTQGGRAIALPSDVVIDLTTAVPIVAGTPPNVTIIAGTQERSRLPVDPYTGYVDIVISPNGQVQQAAAASSDSPQTSLPFYHFWLCERWDVHEPKLQQGVPYQLPMPLHASGYASQGESDLKGERRLVTLFPRTGRISVTEPTQFSGVNLDQPFYEAQAGLKNSTK